MGIEIALREAWEREVKDPDVAHKLDKLVRQFGPAGAGTGGKEITGSYTISQEKKHKVIDYYFNKSMRVKNIADTLDLDRSAVSKLISRWKQKQGS